MRVLCTFPGRAGDLLWALPTVRAVSEHFATPVDLCVAGEFAGMRGLLRQQPYLAQVWAEPHWGLTPPDEWNPPLDPDAAAFYDRVFRLGYRGWPDRALPREAHYSLALEWNRPQDGSLPAIDLQRPWIACDTAIPLTPAPLVVGFTEAWFELKAGLIACLREREIPDLPDGAILTPPGSRWCTELGYAGTGWQQAAQLIRDARIVLADCSALHVLAVAMGKPVVVMEPMEARHNSVFWPLGWDGPQVTIVKGLDGRPTFDARHTAETLEKVLHGR